MQFSREVLRRHQRVIPASYPLIHTLRGPRYILKEGSDRPTRCLSEQYFLFLYWCQLLIILHIHLSFFNGPHSFLTHKHVHTSIYNESVSTRLNCAAETEKVSVCVCIESFRIISVCLFAHIDVATGLEVDTLLWTVLLIGLQGTHDAFEGQLCVFRRSEVH